MVCFGIRDWSTSVLYHGLKWYPDGVHDPYVRRIADGVLPELLAAHPAVMVVVAFSPKDAWEQRLHRLGDTAPEVIGANARVFNDPW